MTWFFFGGRREYFHIDLSEHWAKPGLKLGLEILKLNPTNKPFPKAKKQMKSHMVSTSSKKKKSLMKLKVKMC